MEKKGSQLEEKVIVLQEFMFGEPTGFTPAIFDLARTFSLTSKRYERFPDLWQRRRPFISNIKLTDDEICGQVGHKSDEHACMYATQRHSQTSDVSLFITNNFNKLIY